MEGITAILIGIAALMVLQLGVWAVLGYRAWREFRDAPFLRDVLAKGDEPAEWPRVGVVVPAHNERLVAGACAKSILASTYPNLEVVFVLDRCTDGTREALQPIADQDARLRIVENESCPPDWAGKCNAARLGAAQVQGDLLLFTDADTVFHPDLLRASVLLMRQRRWDMLSLLSAPTHNHWFENVVQPIASIALLKLFPMRRANMEGDRRAFANGQFMLFDRRAYEALGGHDAVKGDLLEDMGFARRMKATGMRQGVGASGGMLAVSMYDDWKSFRSGWRRIFIECCVRNPARLQRQALQLLAAGPLLSLVWLAGFAFSAWTVWWGPCEAATWAMVALSLSVGAYGASKLTLLGAYRACAFPLWTVFLYPVGCTAVAGIFLQGARDLRVRRPVRWGGREYVLEPTNH